MTSQTTDISVNDFENFHNLMVAKNMKKINDEFRNLQTFGECFLETCHVSKDNQTLNRFKNISPFDSNRVILDQDEFENSYINASYIDVWLK